MKAIDLDDDRPLLLLDVDGPLNVYGAQHNTLHKVGLKSYYFSFATDRDDSDFGFRDVVDVDAYKANKKAWKNWSKDRYANWNGNQKKPDVSVLQLNFDPNVGDKLLTLADDLNAQLAWATTWNQHANVLVSPLVGLPQDLPGVMFTPDDRWGVSGGTYWKTKRVVRDTGDRRFVWFDDEVTRIDRQYVDLAKGTGHSRSLHVSQGTGLRDNHFDFARTFLGS